MCPINSFRRNSRRTTLNLATAAAAVVLSGAAGAVAVAGWWQEARTAALDRPLVVEHDEASWTVTPRTLEATPDTAAFLTAARMMLAGDWDAGLTLPLSPDDAQVERTVAELAAAVGEEPSDAAFTLADGQVEVVAGRTGLAVDRAEAAQRITHAVRVGAGTVDLPVAQHAPAVPTEAAETALPEVQDAVDSALDATVTLVLPDGEEQVTPRDLGATVDAEALEEASAQLAEEGAVDVTPSVHVGADAVDAHVDELAAGIDRSPRDAELDWSSGELEIVPERTGRAVQRGQLAADLRAALESGGGTVNVPVEETAPAVTADDYDMVLVVRQSERELSLYEDGEVTRTWPVAIGQPSNPTPTGVFTVGAKRHRPSWTNPSPDGWGADMPAHVGPGPDNPLGVRALNWNRDGRDTLIRFHGTSETSSIGQAASRGCVRLTNDDVRELYELVPTGTTIVSLH